jgi:hypothetical protein
METMGFHQVGGTVRARHSNGGRGVLGMSTNPSSRSEEKPRETHEERRSTYVVSRSSKSTETREENVESSPTNAPGKVQMNS